MSCEHCIEKMTFNEREPRVVCVGRPCDTQLRARAEKAEQEVERLTADVEDRVMRYLALERKMMDVWNELQQVRERWIQAEEVQVRKIYPLLAERDALAERLATAERALAEMDRQVRENWVPFPAHDAWKERALTAEAAVARAGQREARVRAAHPPLNHAVRGHVCEGCSTTEWQPWPCPTIAALDGMVEVESILQEFRPGSHDWTWVEEFRDIRTRDAVALAELEADVRTNGIREPLLLGDDGRLWDGHHRLIVAVDLGLHAVPVTHGHSAAALNEGDTE